MLNLLALLILPNTALWNADIKLIMYWKMIEPVMINEKTPKMDPAAQNR